MKGETQDNLVYRTLISEFSSDGYNILFLSDSDLDLGGSVNIAAWTGYMNHLLLSDANAHGALVYSPNHLPAIVRFYHSADVVDIDGDGDKDIAVLKFPRANDTHPGQVMRVVIVTRGMGSGGGERPPLDRLQPPSVAYHIVEHVGGREEGGFGLGRQRPNVGLTAEGPPAAWTGTSVPRTSAG